MLCRLFSNHDGGSRTNNECTGNGLLERPREHFRLELEFVEPGVGSRSQSGNCAGTRQPRHHFGRGNVERRTQCLYNLDQHPGRQW